MRGRPANARKVVLLICPLCTEEYDQRYYNAITKKSKYKHSLRTTRGQNRGSYFCLEE